MVPGEDVTGTVGVRDGGGSIVIGASVGDGVIGVGNVGGEGIGVNGCNGMGAAVAVVVATVCCGAGVEYIFTGVAVWDGVVIGEAKSRGMVDGDCVGVLVLGGCRDIGIRG